VPGQAIILARISDARDGDERGVSDQLADCQRLADRLGWSVGPAVTHHLIENDTSAFKRKRIALPDGRSELRTVRPRFREALAMLADGRADGLVVYDLDRTARDPRDLEDLIDAIEASRPRIPVESVTGTLRLDGDGDITMARVLLAVANKASRDTARRVARARLRQAGAGQHGGGKRPYGYEADGVRVREAEAAEVRRAADAVLAGVSLNQITASLRERGVPSATGAAWTPITMRGILLRPRNAGLRVHRPSDSGRRGREYGDDEIVGPAGWPAILPEENWRAVRAILTDPARDNRAGSTPRWLGSRIFECGLCGDTLVVMGGGGARGYPRYTCVGPPSHLARAAIPVDELVAETLIARLERPDAAGLIPDAGHGIDLAGLRRDAASLRELLDEQARLHARGLIDARQLTAGSAELRGRLQQAEADLAGAAATSPVAGIAGRADARRVWDGLDLGRRRALVRALAEVTIHPARPGRGFKPESVDIRWRS